MKTRISFDISKEPPKKRKQPKRFSSDHSYLDDSKEEEQKENILPDRIKSDFSKDKDNGKPTKKKKTKKRKELLSTAMKTKRSLDIRKEPPKKRKQPKRVSLDPNYLEDSKEEEQKENILPDRIKSDFSKYKDNGKPTKKRKTKKGNVQYYRDLDSSLQANNRALATALEEARGRTNALNQENMCLKKRLHCERQFYIERIGKEVEQKVQYRFKAVEDCLQETIRKLLESSELIASAMKMVSMPTNTTTLTPVSCPIPGHSCDTTPPPDVPDFMEATTTELLPMEMTESGDVEMLVSKETNFISSQFQVPQVTDQVSADEQVISSDDTRHHYTDDASETSDESQTESSLDICMRGKRRRSSNVSYVMPSLRSKLRRGDPFTDHFFKETFYLTKSKTKGRMSTGCIQKKPRHALGNLTNIITEEQEA